MVSEDVIGLVNLSVELSRGRVPKDGGGRGLVMVLEDEPVGVLGPGGQPAPKCLLSCGDLLFLV